MTTNTHKCFAANCVVQIRRNLLMCIQHWGLVPQELQVEIYEEFNRGGSSDEYRAAIRKARDAVKEVEERMQLKL